MGRVIEGETKEDKFNELFEAYLKYKSFVYYDSSELKQRMQLAQFEVNLFGNSFNLNDIIKSGKKEDYYHKLEEKIFEIIDKLESKDPKKEFQEYLEDISYFLLPKKFRKNDEIKNFISNKRTDEKYELEKVTVFIKMPVELHLIAVLWLMRYGYYLDAQLDDSCLGNRLILNSKRTSIVRGRNLYKPYFGQYQKWRDNAVEEAKRKLDTGNSVAILNLDLKDFFYSARISFKEIEKSLGDKDFSSDSVHVIFKAIHERFAIVLKNLDYPDGKEYPNDKYPLPIGLVSSYVLGNFYLKQFDSRVKNLIPQIYYSRYVDDILIVIDNPDFSFHINEKSSTVGFKVSTYKKILDVLNIKDLYPQNQKVFSRLDFSTRIILQTFFPLVYMKKKEKKKPMFHLTDIPGATFQPEKTMVYYFDANESISVIDKLKKELEERASEFRDFPKDLEDGLSFDGQAYHLIFDGTEGKISTLKDYKENRYGLSVFLANRIFAALRGAKISNKDDLMKVLKVFKGLNTLEHYRLWEKILTFLLINQSPNEFWSFFSHTLEQIEKINSKKSIRNSQINHEMVMNHLIDHLDYSLEMALSLNPDFLLKNQNLLVRFSSHYHFQEKGISIINGLKSNNYVNRLRVSNLLRHHYINFPLKNFKEESVTQNVNLTN